MAGDPAVRVARARKWHELIERHGSEEGAHYAIRESPEWGMTYELHPFGVLDDARLAWTLDLMIAEEVGELEPGKRSAKDEPVDHGAGCRVPFALAEQAVRLKEQDGFGRRRVARRIPGVTDWMAGQVLRWHKVGRPAGLWLEHGRLCWGVSITPIWGDDQDREQRGQTFSPTPIGLLLPRI
jgi:hypothetical protein